MQITLSQEQTKILETLVKLGQYPSLEVAIDTALLFLIDEATQSESEHEPDYLAWVDTTRQKLETAQNQVQCGEVLNVEDVLDSLKHKVEKMRDLTS